MSMPTQSSGRKTLIKSRFQALWGMLFKVFILAALLALGESLAVAASLEFAGRTWNIKQANSPVGPGPNRFSDSPSDVWSDQDGLHLSIHKTGPFWYCTEVILDESLGYGTYVFQTSSRQDILNANAVFGAFTWDSFGGSPIPGDPNREIDFEDSRWGDPLAEFNASMTVQPFSVPGNVSQFNLPDLSQDAELTRFFTWSPRKVEFTALTGHHSPINYPLANVIHQFTYLDNGADHRVPVPDRENFRFNLWLTGSTAPVGDQPVEVVINDFQFLPLPPADDTVLFDFESGDQGWGSFGAVGTSSGELPTGGSSGQGRFHVGDFSIPDQGNFGMVDVSPPGQDLSSFVGLSVDALFKDVEGQPPFAGLKELDIAVETPSGEEFFAPKITLSDSYQTYAVAFDDFQSGLTGLAPTPTVLSNVMIKLIVFNTNGTGTAELNYDQITGLKSINNTDFDADLDFDGNDFLIWQRGYGAGGLHSSGDADSSTDVDGNDLILWESQFGSPVAGSSAGLAAVPESRCLVLSFIASVSWLTIWRRHS